MKKKNPEYGKQKFETAKLAKEKGFNWECSNYYTNKETKNPKEGFSDCYWGDNRKNDWNSLISEPYEPFSTNPISAPSQSLLAKWLREKHGIHVEVTFDAWNNEKYEVSICQKGNKDLDFDVMGNFDTFEQAYEKGLQEALKLIK